MGATLVYSSTAVGLPASIGWVDFTFSTPFIWNGTDNVMVLTRWVRTGAGTAAVNWAATSGFNPAVVSHSFSATTTMGSLYTTGSRANIHFSVTPVGINKLETDAKFLVYPNPAKDKINLKFLRIGVVETHGRAETENVAQDLPRLPLKQVPHRGHVLREFDLDGALAWAADQTEPLLLLDELAHSNAPGSRHPKRWQDVLELLDSGVDVWSTMNVQHLESLNDIVSDITGVRVLESVPDRVFDDADEVVVVDLPPDELLERLKQGKVYLGPQAERAAANFFRKGNLLALRELALRRSADRVDDEMRAYRRASTTTAEAVLLRLLLLRHRPVPPDPGARARQLLGWLCAASTQR